MIRSFRLYCLCATLLLAAFAYPLKRPESFGRQHHHKTAISDSAEILDFGVNGVRIRMRRVERGSFMMGGTSEQHRDPVSTDRPAHLVSVPTFYLAETEVTNQLWQAVMLDDVVWIADDCPVVMVSWLQCQEFIRRLDSITGIPFRLPYEEEWEYAARGGAYALPLRYAGSDVPDSVAWLYCNSGNRTHAVARKQPNRLGLYDMTGNVWEWCQNVYAPYSSDPQIFTSPIPMNDNRLLPRVMRGASWDNALANAHLSVRRVEKPQYAFHDCGLRLALSVIPEKETLPERQKCTIGTIDSWFRWVEGNDSLRGFYIGETEVTQALWRAVMHHNPSARKKSANPVENVSYEDCTQFIFRLNSLTGRHFRLPTEAEWLYAAMGGRLGVPFVGRNRSSLILSSDSIRQVKKVSYRKRKALEKLNMWANLIYVSIDVPEDETLRAFQAAAMDSVPYLYAGGDKIELLGWYKLNAKGKPHKVAELNPNELGLFDMTGNVAEWCLQRGLYKPIKGGHFLRDERACQIMRTDSLASTSALPSVGFRLVLEAD